jgi:Yip1 domain.
MGILFSVFLALVTVIIHGFIMLMGGKRTIKNTFRLICYSSGVGFFSIFPIFGFNISSSWFAALLAIGVKETNKLSTARSILVILVPYIAVSIVLTMLIIRIISLR